MLIVVRITMGLGWTRETSRLGTGSMVFAPAPVPRDTRRNWTDTSPVIAENSISHETSFGNQSGYLMTLKGSPSQISKEYGSATKIGPVTAE